MATIEQLDSDDEMPELVRLEVGREREAGWDVVGCVGCGWSVGVCTERPCGSNASSLDP